jgi:hypothetical protein
MGVDYRQYSREQAEVIVDTTIFCPGRLECRRGRRGGRRRQLSPTSLIVLAGGALQAVAEAAGLIDQIAARIEDAIGLRDNVPHAPREGATSP